MSTPTRARTLAIAAFLSGLGAVAASCGGAQKPAEKRVSAELAAKLDAFDARLEAKRKELGIPGLALVIVKDDEVVYLAGKGLRDVDKQLPVDEDTLFAIGSTTKAFTAMLALMAQEEGKLSLDDSPKKCLPYFTLKDEEADAKIKVRDLLTHTSGLMRTDIGWITGKLSKKEVIQLAGRAEGVSKLGEEWHYQNVMYLAAGECIASAMGESYEDLLQKRIFDRIGMKTANASVAKTLTLPTRAVGYGQFGKEKQLRPVAMRPLDNIAPAGAINASARDMGQWLRLMLGRGKHGGQQLITEESYAKLLKPYIQVGTNVGYGLGWGLAKWNDRDQITHTGGIDGFVTLVALLPSENLGFGLFTNIQNADIHGYVTNEVFSLFTGEGAAGVASGKPASGAAAEAGTYGVIGGMKIVVKWEENKLTLEAPNQPAYPLEPVEGRRYRLGAPAPAGFYATFRDSDTAPGKAELFLEQPQGNMALPRLTEEAIAAAKKETPPAEMMELVGGYVLKDAPIEIEVKVSEGRVAVAVPGQPSLPLVAAGKDLYSLAGMPKEYQVEIQRDESGAVSGLVLKRPGGTTEAKRVAGSGGPTVTVEELMTKAAEAHGAEALAKHTSMVLHSTASLVNQGLGGKDVTYRRAPDKYASETTLTAFDREIGSITARFDGQSASEELSFMPTDEPSTAQTDALRVEARFNPWVDWKAGFDEIRVTRTSKVGDESAFVVEKKRASGIVITEFYSQKSFLLLKRSEVVPSSEDGPPITSTSVFGDYRNVGGVMLPHRVETAHFAVGKIVSVVDKVELDVEIADSKFTGEEKR